MTRNFNRRDVVDIVKLLRLKVNNNSNQNQIDSRLWHYVAVSSESEIYVILNEKENWYCSDPQGQI